MNLANHSTITWSILNLYYLRDLAEALHHLGIGDKMVHLMHTAVSTVGIRLLVMMLSMLIIDVTIFLAFFLNHTDTIHVVMMAHHRG